MGMAIIISVLMPCSRTRKLSTRRKFGVAMVMQTPKITSRIASDTSRICSTLPTFAVSRPSLTIRS